MLSGRFSLFVPTQVLQCCMMRSIAPVSKMHLPSVITWHLDALALSGFEDGKCSLPGSHPDYTNHRVIVAVLSHLDSMNRRWSSGILLINQSSLVRDPARIRRWTAWLCISAYRHRFPDGAAIFWPLRSRLIRRSGLDGLNVTTSAFPLLSIENVTLLSKLFTPTYSSSKPFTQGTNAYKPLLYVLIKC